WDSRSDELANTADRVLFLADFFDERDHLLCRSFLGATDGTRLHLFHSYLRRIGDVGSDGAHLLDIPKDAHALLGQEFLGDRTRGNPAEGLASAGAAAAAVVANPVLGVEREIGVAGTILVLNIAVVLAVLICVVEQDAD